MLQQSSGTLVVSNVVKVRVPLNAPPQRVLKSSKQSPVLYWGPQFRNVVCWVRQGDTGIQIGAGPELEVDDADVVVDDDIVDEELLDDGGLDEELLDDETLDDELVVDSGLNEEPLEDETL